MTALIILIIFGLGMAVFATQNTGVIHISIGSYVLTGIPIYVLVVGSILLGIFISWIISMASSISSFMMLRGKDASLHQAQKTIRDLEEKNNKLSLEIARFKGQEGTKEEIKHEEKTMSPSTSFFHNIRHKFT